MKKVMYISGIIAVVLMTLLLTGWAAADDDIKKSLRQGNKQYESADYEAALKSYETGLITNPEHKALNFNAAQAAYLLGEYEKAVGYYEKSGDCTEKFLNAGNIYFWAGDAAQDENQKAECYIKSMQIYQEGIIKFPQNVPLKYNYELVKEKVEAIMQESQQQDSSQGEEGDNEENEVQESESSEASQEGQEQESESSEASQENQEQASEQEQSEAQDEGDEQQESYSQEEAQGEQDKEAIERILQMLENQEEQSLKNNQEVVGGNEGKYGW